MQNHQARPSVASRGLNSVCYSRQVRETVRIVRVILTGAVGFLYLNRAVEELQSWCAQKPIQNHRA
eukprot:5928190-Pyramimonas_sp.AAC.1